MTAHTQGKMKAQKRPEETLDLYLRLTFGRETAYNNETKKGASPGKGENMISKVNTLLDLNVRCSTKITGQTKRQETWPVQRKNTDRNLSLEDLCACMLSRV